MSHSPNIDLTGWLFRHIPGINLIVVRKIELIMPGLGAISYYK
jgi:hypothetical protein